MAAGFFERYSSIGSSICVAGAWLIAAADPSEAAAQAPAMSLERARSEVRDSFARSASRLGIAADPAVVEDWANNATIFAGNGCFGSPPKDNCAATLGTPAVLDRITAAMLSEIGTARPAEIETLASRLATAVGVEIERAGWPRSVPNEIAVVEIPPELQHSAVSVRTATGLRPAGANARLLLLLPGRSLVVFTGAGPVFEKTVNAAARSRAALGSAAPSRSDIGRIDPPRVSCADEPTIKFEGPYAYYNWGRVKFAESEAIRVSNLAPFAGQYAVDIGIFEEVAGTCRADCVLALGTAFAQSIAVWRSGCARCGSNALASIKVGDHVWLDARAAARLRRSASGTLTAGSLDLQRASADEMQTSEFSGAVFGAPMVRVSYEQLNSDPALSRALCAAPKDAGPWIAGAQQLACPGGTGVGGPLRPRLTLKTASTSCGPAADFLACGKPEGSVELALEGSNYVFDGPAGPLSLGGSAGGEKMAGFPVILHELGHWFGVPHPDSAGGNILDLMSSTWDPARACVSTATLLMMNNAADLRWGYRVTGNQGLRRGRTR